MPLILTKHDKRTGLTDILVVLEDESIDRIKQHDPFEMDVLAIAHRHAPSARCRAVGVVWGSADDIVEIVRLQRAGQEPEAFRYATRGFTVHDEDLAQITRVKSGQQPD